MTDRKFEQAVSDAKTAIGQGVEVSSERAKQAIESLEKLVALASDAIDEKAVVARQASRRAVSYTAGRVSEHPLKAVAIVAAAALLAGWLVSCCCKGDEDCRG